MKKIMLSMLAAVSFYASAQGVPINVLVQALRDGQATQSLQGDRRYARLIQTVQSKTGSTGDVIVAARLLKRFDQQPKCGRVVFAIAQPSTRTYWADMGGQLNICESGSPPLKVCREKTEILVSPYSVCERGSTPIDSPEVERAIHEAIFSGSMSQDELIKRLGKSTKTTPKGP